MVDALPVWKMSKCHILGWTCFFFWGGGSLISESDVHVSLESPNQRSVSDTSHEKMEYPKIGGQKVTWHVPYVYAPHPRPVLL